MVVVDTSAARLVHKPGSSWRAMYMFSEIGRRPAYPRQTLKEGQTTTQKIPLKWLELGSCQKTRHSSRPKPKRDSLRLRRLSLKEWVPDQRFFRNKHSTEVLG
jgi:hypothetical protein